MYGIKKIVSTLSYSTFESALSLTCLRHFLNLKHVRDNADSKVEYDKGPMCVEMHWILNFIKTYNMKILQVAFLLLFNHKPLQVYGTCNSCDNW